MTCKTQSVNGSDREPERRSSVLREPAESAAGRAHERSICVCAFSRPKRRYCLPDGTWYGPEADATPSADDVLVTRQIVEAGRLLDVDVLDHLVIGRGTYVSMRDRRMGF